MTNFLEININSNKLYCYLDNVSTQLNSHTMQLNDLQNISQTHKNFISAIIEKREADTQAIHQQLSKIQSQLLVLVEKQTSDYEGICEKINEQRELIGSRSDQKITMMEQDMKDLNNVVHARNNQIIINTETVKKQRNENQSKFKQLGEVLAEHEKQVQILKTRMNEESQIVLLKVDAMIKKSLANKNSGKTLSQLHYPMQNHGRQRANERMEENCKWSERPQSKLVRKKTKRMMTNLEYTTWAAMSEKMKQVDRKIEEKERKFNQNEKIMFSTASEADLLRKSKSKESSNFFKTSINMFNEQKQQKQAKQALQKQSKAMMQQLENKIKVLNEKSDMNGRKIEREIRKVEEIKFQFSKISEKKTPNEVLEVLSNQLRKNNMELFAEMQKKMSLERFQCEKIALIDKIHFLEESLMRKAEKGEMKQAFLFLQEKIRELIFYTVGEQVKQKEGMIYKTPFKCLSCDRFKNIDIASHSNTPTGVSRKNSAIRKKVNKLWSQPSA